MNKKICFIINGENDFLCQEVLHYISYLNIPDGYEIEYTIKDGNTVYAYNEGMKETNAKYKVYLNENIFLVDQDLLVNVMDIFDNNENIGMLGALGYKVSRDNGEESLHQVGRFIKVGYEKKIENFDESIESGLVEVDALDSRCIITSIDTPWQGNSESEAVVNKCNMLKNNGIRSCVLIKKDAWCLFDNE